MCDGNCNQCNPCDKSCKKQDCGCKFEVDAACVRYTKKDLVCIGRPKGSNLEDILDAVDDKLCNMSQGPEGPKGEPGTDGIDGERGIQGNIGLTGQTGPIGPKGDPGNNGTNGLPGTVGPQGPIGPQGNAGPIGPKGDTGTSGAIGGVGPQGPIGPKGDAGVKGDTGSPSSITFQENCDITVTQLTGAPNYNFNVAIQQTSWTDLLGFNHMSTNKPQVRRIGSILYFRGDGYIPLKDNLGALIPMPTYTTYETKAVSSVYDGVGGCSINANGSITFNRDGGVNYSVIPSSVLCGKVVDGTTIKDIITHRAIAHGGTIGGDDGITVSNPVNGVSLSAWFRMIIQNTGKLSVHTIRDVEDNTSSFDMYFGGSALRLITSNVIQGQQVPNYEVTPSIHTSTTPGLKTLQANFDGPSGNVLSKYNFSCNAGNPAQIGGFILNFDNLIVHLI